MDQVMIGKFIAACRKEQNLTQAALAEKLGITDRAVSKWENGRSLPDSSIMLELCELLSINVNELLKGERVAMEESVKVSEELIISLKQQNEEKTKLLLRIETLMGILVIGICMSQMLVGGFLVSTNTPDNQWIGIALITINCVAVILFGFIGVLIEQQAGYYECADCGYRYKPKYMHALMAPHIGRSRKMCCPKCGKKNYHKKVLSDC